MREKLTAEDFRPCLDDTFILVTGDGAAVPIQLIDVMEFEENPWRPQRERERPFSIVFRRVGAECALPQRIYPLEHPRFGRLEVFLVPIGFDAQGMRYEAVFT